MPKLLLVQVDHTTSNSNHPPAIMVAVAAMGATCHSPSARHMGVPTWYTMTKMLHRMAFSNTAVLLAETNISYPRRQNNSKRMWKSLLGNSMLLEQHCLIQEAMGTLVEDILPQKNQVGINCIFSIPLGNLTDFPHAELISKTQTTVHKIFHKTAGESLNLVIDEEFYVSDQAAGVSWL